MNWNKWRFTPTRPPSISPTPGGGLKGDVNGDGKIEQVDADLLLEHLRGRTNAINRSNSDMNNDGELSIADVQLILNKLREAPQPTPTPTRQAKRTVPAFTDSGLNNRIGNERVDAGDTVAVLNETSGAYFVRYPTSNGTKDRWVSKDIFVDPPPVTAQLQSLINRWEGKTWVNGTFSGWNEVTNPKVARECKEFAAYIFGQLYLEGKGYYNGGYIGGSETDYTIAIANKNKVACRGTKINITVSDVKELFQNAQPGDLVQMKRRYGDKNPIKAYAFTSDADSFIDNINRVINNSFNDNQGAEYGLTAITDTANGALSLNFDSDADKYFVVITDEGYTENVSYSDTVIASLRAADIQVDVLGMPLSRASSHNDELECQPEWEPIATSTGGEFYDIAGNYYPTLKKIVLNTTDGKAVVVDLNLVSGSETGCFVLDDDTSMIAKFNHSTVEGDTVVGFVNSDHVYEAVGDSTRQKITIPDRWKVTATDKKDELNIIGSNATVSGSNGKDYISFSSNTQIVTLTDLNVSEDELTFDNRVEPGSLTSTVENGQLTFSSSGLTFTLADQSNLSSDIRNYTVHNAGSDNTIHELLYGDNHTHVVELTTWNYGFTPNNSIISLASLNNLDDDQTPTDFATLLADGSSSSLWGGFEGDDTLIGTDGRDEFFYLKGNGRDVIENASDDDLINLLNIGLEDISALDVRADSITIGFNDGGSLRVNSSADIGFRLSDGSTWHAVERGTSNTHWEAKS